MNPLALFTGPYALLARWVVIGLLCAALFGYGWVKGNEHGTQKLTDYQGKQAVEGNKIIVKQGEVTVRETTKYLDRVKLVEGATTTIEREVIKYVDSKPLAMACALDALWVRLHDSAAAGSVPPPASGDDESPGGISAAEALPQVTGNYARANRNKETLTFCQNWVREQYKAMNGRALGY